MNKSLELEVTDFGPIIEAKIDLRPLTVFLGPSNTGKSYLAILIYALHRVFGGDPRSGKEGFFSTRLPFNLKNKKLSESSANALWEMARSFGELDSRSELQDQDSLVLAPSVADELCSSIDKLAYNLSSEIRRCFGIHETRALLRKGRTVSQIAVRRQISDRDCFVEHKISLAHETEFNSMIPSEKPIWVGEDRFRHFLESSPMYFMKQPRIEKIDRQFLISRLLSSVVEMTLPSLVGPLHLPAYYLPADRTGVMHAHSAMVGALIANAPFAGLRSAPHTPTLSGVLADFLGQLIEIAQTERPEGKRKMEHVIAEIIENSILDGAVRVDRSTPINYPRFSYRPHGWKDNLELANASSMVSELAPMVLYLRHMIEPNNVLIVEEPESHLHPEMQVEFTCQLAALVNAGVRVIVTTHSEWLLEALANIVRRSELPAAANDGKVTLRPEQVGVWLFKPKQRPKGSVVKEIPIDESGLYPSDYEDVSKTLYNDWVDIENGIEGNL